MSSEAKPERDTFVNELLDAKEAVDNLLDVEGLDDAARADIDAALHHLWRVYVRTYGIDPESIERGSLWR